jgi:hypothetical protein
VYSPWDEFKGQRDPRFKISKKIFLQKLLFLKSKNEFEKYAEQKRMGEFKK